MRPMHLLVGCLLAAFLSAPDASLEAAADDRPATRIALLADPHVSVRPDASAYRRNFERIIEKVNDEAVDAVLIAGDLTTHGFRMAAEDLQDYLDRFDAPVHVVPGNHDIGNKPLPDRPGTVSDQRLAHYEDAMGPSFYDVQLAPGMRLIGLNSLLMGTGLEREPAQWDMLEEALASPSDAFTLVLTHHPPFVEEPDEADDYFNIEPDSRQRLLQLLSQARVDLLLAGHTHRPLTLEHEGIPHMIAPAISFGLPRDQQPEGWTLITIEPDGEISREDRFLTPELAQVDQAWLDKLQPIAPIAVMPMAESGNRVAAFFRNRGLDGVLAPLSGEQMVDPEHFTPDRYPATFYLGGEAFLRNVHESADAERALMRYLRDGGLLVVLPSLPYPFYANERGDPVDTADRLGIWLLASGQQEGEAFGFESPDDDEALRFIVNDPLLREAGLDETLNYPDSGDLRWRPQVHLRERNHYEPLINLTDERGRARGDGLVYAEQFNRAGQRTARTLYAASVLTQVHPEREAIIEGILTFLVDRLTDGDDQTTDE